MAVSSLTVARQRGICTRFPVFAERRRRAFRKIPKNKNNVEKSNGCRGEVNRVPSGRARWEIPPPSSDEHTAPAKAARSPATKSPVENKTWCSFRDKQCLPAIVPAGSLCARQGEHNSRHYQQDSEDEQQFADIGQSILPFYSRFSLKVSIEKLAVRVVVLAA